MREPRPASDLYGVGHLLLFLLYAGYEEPAAGKTGAPGQEPEPGWDEELELSAGRPS
ncbi:hypothetical protein IDH44_06100 [Paenibacillus sp. IB182496]|uniref:Uncharacterized protein n=1 Tax=Paenibacillus sabuli TaxID=2772509 RepID=A0A927GQY6_9BACL|nr:hypothetical protein [Paenibacillus sabuli]MBD2844756.1 hypothetical protein [Paenibacillus sabuli]